MSNFEEEIKEYGLFYLEKIKENIRKEIDNCFTNIINNEKVEIAKSFEGVIEKIKEL